MWPCMVPMPQIERRGRPSKGDRHRFAPKVPRAAADVLMAEADRRGCTYGDLIAFIVCQHFGVEMAEPGLNRSREEQLPLPHSA